MHSLPTPQPRGAAVMIMFPRPLSPKIRRTQAIEGLAEKEQGQQAPQQPPAAGGS